MIIRPSGVQTMSIGPETVVTSVSSKSAGTTDTADADSAEPAATDSKRAIAARAVIATPAIESFRVFTSFSWFQLEGQPRVASRVEDGPGDRASCRRVRRPRSDRPRGCAAFAYAAGRKTRSYLRHGVVSTSTSSIA